MKNKSYLLVPIPKSPYYRIGPEKWQDWYRQTVRTVQVARKLRGEGGETVIAILSNFQPKGKPSEIEIYTSTLRRLAPEFDVRTFKETNDTLGQIERGFELGREMAAEVIFLSAWMQYPRVRYLGRGKKARHYGIFGIPSPIFAFVDPLAMILQPLIMLLGLGAFFQRITVRRREKGVVW
jgi:hypothetical protein